MKKLLLPCALALGALFGGASPALAAPCTVTPLVRDAHNLTAQIVATDGQTVTGLVDASGCDIGVYVGSGIHATVDTAEVENARYFGVVTQGPDSSTEITNSQIHDIGDQPIGSSGSQHGIGAAWIDGSSGSIHDSSVYRYQKGGVVVDGDGTSADTINNTITGIGPTPVIAQNGVQYSRGASGEASYNSISDNDYTGCSNKDAAKTGCTPFVSTGLLLFDVDPNAVPRHRNLYRDDQRNEFVEPSAQVNAGS